MSDGADDYLSKYQFQIGEFVGYENDNGQAELDIVPSTWVKYKFDENRLVMKYPDDKSAGDLAQLQSMVKLKQKPRTSWPEWHIVLKGGANEYDTAVRRMEYLKTHPYAFTTDQDEEFEKKSKFQTELYEKEALKKIMAITKQQKDQLSDEVSEVASSSSESDSTGDSDQMSARCSKVVKSKINNQRQRKSSKSTMKNQLLVTKAKKNDMTSKSTKTTPLNDLDDQPNNDSKVPKVKGKSVVSSTQQKLKFTPKLNKNKQHKNRDTINHEQIEEEHIETPMGFSQGMQREKLKSVPISSNVQSMGNTDDSVSKPNDKKPMKLIPEKNSHDHPNKTSKFSEEGQAILRGISALKVDNQEIKTLLKKLLSERSATANTELLEALENLEVKWPLETEEEWLKFNNKLKENGDFTKLLIRALKNQLDTQTNSVTKSMHNICRMIFTKDLIMKCTPLSKAKDQSKTIVFKEHSVYSVVRDVLFGFHTVGKNQIGFKEYHEALRYAFGNSKDWGGRVKVEPKDKNETPDEDE